MELKDPRKLLDVRFKIPMKRYYQFSEKSGDATAESSTIDGADTSQILTIVREKTESNQNPEYIKLESQLPKMNLKILSVEFSAPDDDDAPSTPSENDASEGNLIIDESFIADNTELDSTKETNTNSTVDEISNDVYQSPLLNSDFSNISKTNRYQTVPTNTNPSLKRKIIAKTVPESADKDYPEELKKLLLPLACDLCQIKGNSPASITMHYQSKLHLKKLNSWLDDWSQRTGEPIPKRPMQRAKNVEGVTGPNALHCAACDLPLTSVQHANQHYLGRKHRQVVAKKSSPSGPGHYGRDGKWIRELKGVDDRFGIGQLFVKNDYAILSEKIPNEVGTTSKLAANAPTTRTEHKKTETNTTNLDSSNKPSPVEAAMSVVNPVDPTNPKYCTICKISVTCEEQMQDHLKGTKHAKKLRAIDAPPHASPNDTILSSVQNINFYNSNANDKLDTSVFRTPSGQYYCKSCDLTFANDNLFVQHKGSKKHLKKLRELIVASLPPIK